MAMIATTFHYVTAIYMPDIMGVLRGIFEICHINHIDFDV
jgi:hypothetical protein